MALSSGTKLGPYVIVSLVGAGGMGEVYRARDERLRRDVAIKVLPASFASDPDRLRRFEQEAQSTAALNHPNIVGLYDTGIHEGGPYLVSELLEGETLREKIQGHSLTLRKAVEYGVQIARGLAAAHQRGIVHRDLKPENVFITGDGHAKILDFGLAKLTWQGLAMQMEAGSETMAVQESAAGTLVGTAGYMSPEQVRGKPVDARSDVFSFGALMYEMLSGRRAFAGTTPADTISSILNHDPPPLETTEQRITPALDRIVRHCLEKNPEERFQSARDLAFDLESLSAPSSTTMATADADRVSRWRRWRIPGLAAVLLALAALGGYYVAAHNVGQQPAFQRIAFRRGSVRSARFGPDQQSVIYAAAWEGRPPEVFSTVSNNPEARSLGLNNTTLFAVSETGEAAVGLNLRIGPSPESTLARIPLAGGVPREVMENVQYADWGPHDALAVVYDLNGKSRLEYPIGHLIAETNGKFSDVRLSRDGQKIGLVEHGSRYDYSGHISVIDLNGKKTDLTGRFENVEGLAWSADGKEIWFSASPGSLALDLNAVSLTGKLRLVLRGPGILQLKDIASDGRVLLTRDAQRLGVVVQVPGEPGPRDLSWFDYSFGHDLSEDGKLVLFTEQGEAVGSGENVSYVRQTDGSPAVRIADGEGGTFSPDMKWALVTRPTAGSDELWLVPLRAGEPKKIPTPGLQIESTAFLPDGKRILLLAKEAGHGGRIYLQDLATNQRKAISPEGVTMPMVAVGLKCISFDGKWVVLRSPEGKGTAYAVDGGETRNLPGLASTDVPIVFSRDGNSLFVFDASATPAKTYRLDLVTGRRSLWKSPVPTETNGVLGTFPSKIVQDGKGYIYPYRQVLSDLYVVTGLK